MNQAGMAYRGDTTDPLEIIIQRQRAIRRYVLFMLVMAVVPMLARPEFCAGIGRVISTPQRSETVRTAPPAPVAKMSAQALEQLLRNAPASNPAPRDVRCLPDRTWDYVCTYRIDSPRLQPRLRIGVRVNGNAIVQASSPHSLATPLPKP
jgi:hypothetical protein